jgi:hypothetical protein
MTVPLISPQPRLATMHQGPIAPWGNDNELAKEYARDPKAFLMDRCELWMRNVRWMSNLVVCATYFLPAFEIVPGTDKPFYRSEKAQDEALWQGKVGLVIGMGPLAFVDEPALGVHFHGQKVEIGDWVQWDIHDARQCTINRIHCRHLKDTQIIGVWSDPRLVY